MFCYDIIFLCFKLKKGGDLEDYLKKFKDANSNLSSEVVNKWASNLLIALEYLHEKHDPPIIHRDIKPGQLINFFYMFFFKF